MKDIKGYEGMYAVTKEGKIWAYPKSTLSKRWEQGRFLKPWLIGHGYECVSLYPEPRKNTKYLVHRLVAQTFIPNPQNLKEVNHIDSNRLNNRPENLEWVSSKQNKAHAWKLGLYSKNQGGNHYLAKLNDEKVRRIRIAISKGTKNQRQIARDFNVSNSTVSLISRKRIWNHVL